MRMFVVGLFCSQSIKGVQSSWHITRSHGRVSKHGLRVPAATSQGFNGANLALSPMGCPTCATRRAAWMR